MTYAPQFLQVEAVRPGNPNYGNTIVAVNTAHIVLVEPYNDCLNRIVLTGGRELLVITEHAALLDTLNAVPALEGVAA